MRTNRRRTPVPDRRNRRRRSLAAPDTNWVYPEWSQVPAPLVPRAVTEAHTLQDKNATVAKVSVRKQDWSNEHGLSATYAFEATGSAKREQGDRFDPVTGELLALARAYERLSRQVQAEAAKRVNRLTYEQDQADRAKLMKRLTSPKPVHRRTREEWEAMQKASLVPPAFREQAARYGKAVEDAGIKRHEEKAGAFREAWGGKVVEATGIDILDVERGPDFQVQRLKLANGETLVVEPGAVSFESPKGQVYRRVDRA